MRIGHRWGQGFACALPPDSQPDQSRFGKSGQESKNAAVIPAAPCSPEARLKSPTRMPLPPSGSSPATADDHAGNSKKFPQSPPFRSLPDPFAELLAIERTERIDMKDKLGPNTMSRMSHIRRHARCRNAIRQWHAVMLVQRRRERLARAENVRTRSAGRVIVRAWRARVHRVAKAKQVEASIIISRHRLQISVGLRTWQRRVQANTIRKFVKNHTMPRFCHMIHLLRWHAIKIQRCFRAYIAVSKARVRVLRMLFDRRVVERCDAIRAENHQRVMDYEEEKLRIFHEQLQNTENKWHESHARVRSIIVKAATAASRAKRRRRRASRLDHLNNDSSLTQAGLLP